MDKKETCSNCKSCWLYFKGQCDGVDEYEKCDLLEDKKVK